MKKYHFGCSGWSYGDWIGKFYSDECTQKTMLEEYARHLDTVEINMSFYRLPFEGLVRSWRTRTPDGFLFCPKLSRQITHLKKLRDSEQLVSAFMARMGMLGDKLGPVLIQLPPSLRPDKAVLESFLNTLPHDRPYAIEFRNENWFSPHIRSVLEKYGVATCLIDSPKLNVDSEVTAHFSYIRWHGRESWYSYEYSKAEIEEWAEKIVALPVNEVFGYWNNDVNANAPKNCLDLIKCLNVKQTRPRSHRRGSS
ncbi:MAG: DUF72 domain-containing protein [Thermoplasmata archaeon]